MLTVSAPPDFSVAVSPSSQTIDLGGEGAAYTVAVTPQNGFNSDIAISVSGLPDGITATQATVSGGSGSTTISVSETGSLPSGTYAFVITGTGGGLSRSVSASFTHVAKQAIGTVVVNGSQISITFNPCPPMYSCPQTI